MSDIEKIKKEIKENFKNIKPLNNNVNYDKENLTEIERKNIPLEPNLMSYFFRNILGFNVRLKIFEKINYIIEFEYKNKYNKIIHEKMSYRLITDEAIRNELMDLLKNAKNLLEDLFLKISKQGIDDNNFTIENKFNYYNDKLLYIEEKIENIYKKTMKCNESNTHSTEKLITHINLNSKNNKELKYLVEFYIDTLYSLLEHLLILVYPFSDKFSAEKSYMNKIKDTRWNYNKKIEDIFQNKDCEYKDIIEKLKRIKEVYRNRIAHGFFSRELKIFVHVDNFGRYPLFVGKEYLKGFENELELKNYYDLYKETKMIVESILEKIEEHYYLELIYIKSGLPISMDIKDWIKKFSNQEELENEIYKIYYELDNQINMDW